MLFNSLGYLFFLPLVFTIYWSLKRSVKTQNLFLLLASYFFYGLWDYRFLLLILISSLVDYLVGWHLGKNNSATQRKVLLGISLFVNLGFLVFFKYCNFFISSFVDFSNLIGLQTNLSTLNIILPVGISFYTFQTLSYTIDVYRSKITPTRSALNFFTFVAFFPQLVAGPIERASNLLPQIESKRPFSFILGRAGLRQILWGFYKKIVIADNCAIFANEIFNHYQDLGGITLVFGAILFAFQIYGDFSGYSDIAIGTAKLFGIQLKQNFATPYFSRNISEFWRRWHISLSTWFKDYVYIPLGGSRVKRNLQIRNVLIIFLVSGFWHGANWTFLFWGFLHALFYLPQVYLNKHRKYLTVIAKDESFPEIKDLWKIFQTFLMVSFAWIFFRVPTLTDGFYYLRNIFKPTNFQLSSPVQGYDRWSLIYVTCYILGMLIVEWKNRQYSFGLAVMPKNALVRYGCYLLLCFLVIEYFYGDSTFIYFQF